MDLIKRIVLITSGQPSLNPRLVKEADALADEGYHVAVMYQYWNEWGTELDLELLKNKKWKAIRIGGSPIKQRTIYWLTRLNFRFFIFLANKLEYKFNIGENAIGRCSNLLLKKAYKVKADLYIAHNLGALPAAVNAAKKNNAKCGSDAEDFHRQEVNDDINSKQYQLAKFIEDKYLSKVDYFTAASRLIAAEYQELYPSLKPIVINNVFSNDFLQNINQNNQSNQLKLFWFSQTIGKGRGIEDAILAIGSLKRSHINLTLLGNIDTVHQSYFLKLAIQLGLSKDQLIFIKPISPDAIVNLANNYDIGLALETGFCLNNNIALSNKIFTYLTSGLAVIASETTAQKEFIIANPKIGKSYPIGDINALASIITQYDNDRDLLYQTRLASSALAKEKMNWEIESKKFIEIISNTLNS